MPGSRVGVLEGEERRRRGAGVAQTRWRRGCVSGWWGALVCLGATGEISIHTTVGARTRSIAIFVAWSSWPAWKMCWRRAIVQCPVGRVEFARDDVPEHRAARRRSGRAPPVSVRTAVDVGILQFP